MTVGMIKISGIITTIDNYSVQSLPPVSTESRLSCRGLPLVGRRRIGRKDPSAHLERNRAKPRAVTKERTGGQPMFADLRGWPLPKWLRDFFNYWVCTDGEFSSILQRRQIHLITLSARTSTLGGIVRPICFAVLRLIANSNFLGCSTGRSLGFVPLGPYRQRTLHAGSCPPGPARRT